MSDDPKIIEMSNYEPESMVRAMEATINERGWDERPVVGVVSANEIGAMLSELILPDSVYQDFGYGFPVVVEEVGRALHEHKEDDHLPPLLQVMRDEILGPAFFGVLVSMEGWTVPEPDAETNPEEWAEFTADALTGGLHARPDRVEVRTTIALNAMGDAFFLTRTRGVDEPTLVFVDHSNAKVLAESRIPYAAEGFLRICIALLMHRGLFNEDVHRVWVERFEKEREERGE